MCEIKTNVIDSNGPELLINKDAILKDYMMSQEIVTRTERRVAIFGGNSIREESPYYINANNLANKLAAFGISVITGGGDGIMKAANKGACIQNSATTTSIGVRVKSIRSEAIKNQYLQKQYDFDTLSLRLLSMISSCDAVVLFPGGLGTLEEMFSILVRIRVNMLKKIPVYFFGKSFWSGLVNWLNDAPIKENTIDQADINSFTLIDNVDKLAKELIEYIENL